MGPCDLNQEKLYLVEFLVDHVQIAPNLNEHTEILKDLGETCVRFRFLNHPPIEICEEDFCPSTKPLKQDARILMKSGKSCMFSLGSLASRPTSAFDVNITVVRKFLNATVEDEEQEEEEDDEEEEDGGGGDVKKEFLIGRTRVNLEQNFRSVLEQSRDDLVQKKMSTTHTASHKLIDDEGYEVGKILFLVRISCFGQMVVTEFQLSEEEAATYKYKRAQVEPCRTSQSLPKKSSASQPLSDPRGSAEEKDGKKKKKKGTSKDLPCPFEKEKKVTCECRCQCMKPPCPQSTASATSQYPQKQKDMDLDPGSVGIRGNQLVFKMPNKADRQPVEGKFASSVYYTMNGKEDQDGARNIVNIVPQPPQEASPDAVSDKQDVLVLRLGKKRLAAGKRPKLELELRTPKMKDEKPETETQETQYLESDVPKPPKSGKKDGKSGSAGSKKKGKK